MRNILANVPKGQTEMVAAAIRTIFSQPTAELVRKQVDIAADTLEAQFPTVARMLKDSKEEITTFADFPKPHWVKIWSTNPIERSNREVKRRGDVVGIFLNPLALLRLAGCVLIELHDERQAEECRYLSEESMARLVPQAPEAIDPGSPADAGMDTFEAQTLDTGVACYGMIPITTALRAQRFVPLPRNSIDQSGQVRRAGIQELIDQWALMS